MGANVSVSRTGHSWALIDSRWLRFSLGFLLYMCQGVPLGLTLGAVPAWLAANGAEAAQIAGVTSFAALPWGLKMFYGFFMDRYTYLPMGRRKAWLVGAQCLLLVALGLCIAINPGLGNLALLAGLLFVMNVAVTVQDTAIDGIAVDVTPAEEHGRMNSIMAAGQLIGNGACTAIAGSLLIKVGMAGTTAILFLFVATVLALVIFVRERPGEKRLPWLAGSTAHDAQTSATQAWAPLLKAVYAAISRPVVLVFFAVFMCYGFIAGLIDIGAPIYAVQELGWASDRYANIYAAGTMVSGLVGMVFIGPLIDKFGVRLIGFLCYAAISVVGFLFFSAALPLEPSMRFTVLIYAALIIYSGMFIAMTATMMRLCRADIAATQFSLMMAVPNFSRGGFQNVVGPLQDWGGFDLIWLAWIFIGVLACLLWLVGQYLNRGVGTSERVAEDYVAPMS